MKADMMLAEMPGKRPTILAKIMRITHPVASPRGEKVGDCIELASLSS